MRVATIDIGTNTVLLLIAQRGEDGCPRAVAERATITRLGEGVDRTRQLSARAIARTTACLDEYAQIIQAHAVDRVAVVGTSAMRDAGGGASVAAHVRAALGVDARVLSGDEEARLTFRGARSSGLPQSPDSDVAVFDIGGGSTEVVIGRATEPDRLTAMRAASMWAACVSRSASSCATRRALRRGNASSRLCAGPWPAFRPSHATRRPSASPER